MVWAKDNKVFLFSRATNDSLIDLIEEQDRQARLDEHSVILHLTDKAHSYEQNGHGSGIQLFDNDRAERYKELSKDGAADESS